jgi:hypothetical protein
MRQRPHRAGIGDLASLAAHQPSRLAPRAGGSPSRIASRRPIPINSQPAALRALARREPAARRGDGHGADADADADASDGDRRPRGVVS